MTFTVVDNIHTKRLVLARHLSFRSLCRDGSSTSTMSMWLAGRAAAKNGVSADMYAMSPQ